MVLFKYSLIFIFLISVRCFIAQGTWTQKANFGGTQRLGPASFSIDSM